MIAADATTRDRDTAVPAASATPDDRIRYREHDRRGGTLCVTDQSLVVAPTDAPTDSVRDDTIDASHHTGGDHRTADGRVVPLRAVDEVTHRSIDWFTLLLGIGIVGFGLVSTSRNQIGAALFVGAGFISLAVTWRQRDRVRIHTHGRPKPVTVYPSDSEAFLCAIDASLAAVRSDESAPDSDTTGRCHPT